MFFNSITTEFVSFLKIELSILKSFIVTNNISNSLNKFFLGVINIYFVICKL